MGDRTTLTVPLLRDDPPIGHLTIAHQHEPRPFTAQQVALAETFADQAVISIENARLFEELQNRTADLTRALEQQTALADVLGVIASSPTDLQAVLQTITETAARLCDAQ